MKDFSRPNRPHIVGVDGHERDSPTTTASIDKLNLIRDAILVNVNHGPDVAATNFRFIRPKRRLARKGSID